jgi:uncharacterized protein YybS (DUF2232 family)
MKNQVRTITEGSVMLGIIGIFLFLNLQFGLLIQSYFVLIFPIPIIIYTIKYGVKNGLILIFAAITLTLMLGQFTTFFYTVTGLILGLVYGYGILKNHTNDWIISISIIVNSISIFIETYLLAKLFGYDILAEINTIVSELSKIPEFAEILNVDALILSLIPLLLISMSILQTIIVHMISIVLLRRLKISYRKAKPVEDFRLPIWAGVIVTIALFAGQLLTTTNSTTFQVIGINLSVFSQLIAIFYGFCLILFYAKRSGKKFLTTFALLGFLFLPSVIIYVFIGLGLLDCFTDIRKRIELITL